jgi:hypothetical protein
MGGNIDIPPSPPPPPDAADTAVKNARLAERRRQIGLQGRLSTFLTDYQGQKQSSSAAPPASSLLG